MTNTSPESVDLPDYLIETESGIRNRNEVALSSRERISDLPQMDPALLQLLDLDRLLTTEEVMQVFEYIPLVVCADDDSGIQRCLPRIIQSCLMDGHSRVKVLKGDKASLEALSDIQQGDLPLLVCEDGGVLESTILDILQRGISSGLIVSDNDMPLKKGIAVLAQYENDLTGFGKVLQSGGSPSLEIDTMLEKGLIDQFLEKPTENDVARSEYARAFLKAQLNLANK